MVDELKDFMSKMGTGPRSSEDLTYDEAREAMEFILANDLDPASFAAFAVAERWKSQTPEELAGFLDVIRENHLLTDINIVRDVLDVSGRFDGKENSVNTEFAGSVLAVAAGADILTHTGRHVPTQEAVTFLDVLEVLDWDTKPTLEQSERALDEIGFSYTTPSVYAPALEELKPLRRSLGVRTFLNTIESMVNPFQATAHLGSFYHLSFAKRVCDTFQRSETQSPGRVLMIQGIEGQTELRSGDCVIGEWENGDFIDHDLHTEELGFDYTRDDLEAIGPEPSRSAELLRKVVRGGTVPDSYEQSVTVNAGCRLYAAGEADSIEAGIELAQRTLGSSELEETWDAIEGVFSHE